MDYIQRKEEISKAIEVTRIQTAPTHADGIQVSIALAALYNALAQMDMAHTAYIMAGRGA